MNPTRRKRFLAGLLVSVVLVGCQIGSTPPANTPDSANHLTDTPRPSATVSITPANPGRDLAPAAIRQFMADPNLQVVFLRQSTHSQNSTIVVDLWESEEYEFEVTATDARVMSMRHKDSAPQSLGATLDKAALLAHARAFMSAKNRCFEQAEPYLQREEGGDAMLRFFRWTYPQPQVDIPGGTPWAQIVLQRDGRVTAYLDSDICAVDFTHLAPYASPIPSPTYTATPAPMTAQCAVPDRQATVYADWMQYTFVEYGFSFCVPPNWMMSIQYDPVYLETGQPSIMIYFDTPTTAELYIHCKLSGSQALIHPTGVGHGEFFTRGSVQFLGEAVDRSVLVADGADVSVHYGLAENPRGDLICAMILHNYYAGSLDAETQQTADRLIESFLRVK